MTRLASRLSVALLLATAGLSGCGALLSAEGPPTRVYWLTPASDDHSGFGAIAVSAVPGLRSDEILVLKQQQLIPIAGARWAAPLPEVVASVLERALPDSLTARQPDVEIQRFFARSADADATPRDVDVALAVRVCGATRQLTAVSSVAEPRAGAVVQAFQSALSDVVLDFRRLYEEACGREPTPR